MLTVALDVGGSKLAGGLLDATGLRHRIDRTTPGPPGAADPGSLALRALAWELAAAAGAGAVVGRVGMGVCEYVDRGRLTSSEVLAWVDQPADWLPEVFPGASVIVESDVRCGLMAEQRLGAARGLRSAVFVSWGTGLSSALLVNGEIWPGRRGRAIALGELSVLGGGSLESYASGAGMVARHAALTGRRLGSARALLRAVEEGDGAAAEVAGSAGVALADALSVVVHLVDPERVVLGGGLGVAVATAAHQALRQRWRELEAPAPLLAAELGADGPLIGAALAAGWPG